MRKSEKKLFDHDMTILRPARRVAEHGKADDPEARRAKREWAALPAAEKRRIKLAIREDKETQLRLYREKRLNERKAIQEAKELRRTAKKLKLSERDVPEHLPPPVKYGMQNPALVTNKSYTTRTLLNGQVILQLDGKTEIHLKPGADPDQVFYKFVNRQPDEGSYRP